jgi:hypothetical protein
MMNARDIMLPLHRNSPKAPLTKNADVSWSIEHKAIVMDTLSALRQSGATFRNHAQNLSAIQPASETTAKKFYDPILTPRNFLAERFVAQDQPDRIEIAHMRPATGMPRPVRPNLRNTPKFLYDSIGLFIAIDRFV